MSMSMSMTMMISICSDGTSIKRVPLAKSDTNSADVELAPVFAFSRDSGLKTFAATSYSNNRWAPKSRLLSSMVNGKETSASREAISSIPAETAETAETTEQAEGLARRFELKATSTVEEEFRINEHKEYNEYRDDEYEDRIKQITNKLQFDKMNETCHLPFQSSTREPMTRRIDDTIESSTTKLIAAVTKTTTTTTTTLTPISERNEISATKPPPEVRATRESTTTAATTTKQAANPRAATRISRAGRINIRSSNKTSRRTSRDNNNNNKGVDINSNSNTNINTKFELNWRPLKKMNSSPILRLNMVGLLSTMLVFCAADATDLGGGKNQSLQQVQQPLGDLVAMGAISLLDPTISVPIANNQQQQRPSNRLVDQLASSTTRIGGQELSYNGKNINSNNNNNKLDYIVEFMKTNKLTKFCDLLTSQEPELRELNNKLNQLDQFTLFVPTNEALLLMRPSGQLEQLKSKPNEIKQFLLAHATSELVVPTLSLQSAQQDGGQQQQQQQVQSRWHNKNSRQHSQQVLSTTVSSRVVYSLTGSPLRITTVPLIQTTPQKETDMLTMNTNSNTNKNGTNQPADLYKTTKLELIVNGANVISGHSYALQEPNNSSATYAIVHLIDRPLYPTPTGTLMDKVRNVAPIMANFIDMAKDSLVDEALESQSRQSTLFIVNDEAFRATPTKMLDQLNSNHTFLVEFLRGHLVDGLYFSGQLASGQLELKPTANMEHGINQASSVVGKLTSLSGKELEFEPKTLQSRTLVLVNSIPISEPDLMTVNGVAHFITRPIFERHLLEACHCGSTSSNKSSLADLSEAAIYEKLWPKQREELPAMSNNRNQAGVTYELDAQPTIKKLSSNNNIDWTRRQIPVIEAPLVGNELEREESQLQAVHQQQQQASGMVLRTRSQRSGELVARNNRDFYRPSAAPANLLLAQILQPENSKRLIDPTNQPQAQQQQPNNSLRTNTLSRPEEVTQASVSISSVPKLTANGGSTEMFDVDRYKVVLDATTRQRMRENQDGVLNSSNGLQFLYDKPMTGSPSSSDLSPTEPTTVNKRMYSDVNQPATASNVTKNWSRDQLVVSNTDRQQRVLKFQAEDARDPLPGTRISSYNNATLRQQQSAASNLQPAYDIFGPNSSPTNQAPSNSQKTTLQQQQQRAGKTVPPIDGASGCAFYDTDCKRLFGRLVRLPAVRRNKSAGSGGMIESASQNNTQRVNLEQHLDSTFGETSNTLGLQSTWSQSQQRQQQQSKNLGHFDKQVGSNKLSSHRVSPLNQPLPPWSDEEHRSGQPISPNWRPQDSDIPRIGGASKQQILNQGIGFTGGLSRETKQPLGSQAAQNNRPSAQILLVPVKVLHESMMPSIISNLTAAAQQEQQLSQNRHIFTPQNHQIAHDMPSRPSTPAVMFNSNLQYHTPTPYSVSPITTHTPAIFNNNNNNNNLPIGRLTNFTAFETVPSSYDGFDAASSTTLNNGENNFKNSLQNKAKNLRVQQEQQASQIPRAPSAHRKQYLQQVHIDNNGSFGANFDSNPSSGEKQAKKIVRLQMGPSPVKSGPVATPLADYFNNGDILITSAKLTNSSLPPPNFSLSEGLASYASNQAPNVSTNFVRSAPPAVFSGSSVTATSLDPQQQQQSADFFQNRTIAEIMDDSGLRIDNLQVTFSRLKDCLTEADLLGLLTQTDNSLTIFMPTDTAFQRLVQQQAVAHQRERQSNQLSRLSTSAKLLDSGRRNLLPLVVRRNSNLFTTTPTSLSSIIDNSSNSIIVGEQQFSAASAGDRLTLDCSSNQVRQLLLDHLSARLITPKQLNSDIGISNLNGHQLLLSSVPSKKIVVVDGQPVIAATRAKNGMVYVVNKFLNLTQQMPNVIDLIETQPNLTTFKSYLAFSSLADRLKRETGPLTILAPTNEAFEQLSSSARQLINSDPAALMDILRGHIVEGAQFGKLISMRNKLKTMNADQNIEAKVIKPNVYLLDNQMTSMKLVGTTGNGVVNTIDRLIVPSWLKVSMGTKPSILQETSSIIPFTSEIDTASAGSRRQIAGGGQSLNLPLINNQPRRFEQPSNRLSSGSSSFLFANPNETALKVDPESPNNPTSGFGENSPFLSSSSTNPSTTTTSTTTTRSPFLRITSAASNSSLNRFGFDQSSPSATNTTKNMQLIDKLANLMQTKKFVKYLYRSKVSNLLKPDMNYVILVPTDQAVEKLPKQIIDMLDRDPERLADLVNYHVLDTTFEYINTIPDGQTLNTLNEKDILFNWHRNNTILTASGAVVMGGIQEENIALLVVDRVLYPTPGDILNIISKSPILSNFTSIVKNAGLEQQLTLAGPYTLFAPSDFAFNQLERSDLEFLRKNKETARRFLLRHLSQPSIFTSSIALSNTTLTSNNNNNLLSNNNLTLLPTGGAQNNKPQQQSVPTMTISNSLGEDLTLRQRNDYFSVNDVNFSYADVAATNGVIHVIDGLL